MQTYVKVSPYSSSGDFSLIGLLVAWRAIFLFIYLFIFFFLENDEESLLASAGIGAGGCGQYCTQQTQQDMGEDTQERQKSQSLTQHRQQIGKMSNSSNTRARLFKESLA